MSGSLGLRQIHIAVIQRAADTEAAASFIDRFVRPFNGASVQRHYSHGFIGEVLPIVSDASRVAVSDIGVFTSSGDMEHRIW